SPGLSTNRDRLGTAEFTLRESERLVVHDAVVVEHRDDVAARAQHLAEQFVETYGGTEQANEPPLTNERQCDDERVAAVSDTHWAGEVRGPQHLRLTQCLLARHDQFR